MTWKSVLYDYAHARNRAEGEGAGLPALPFVRDHAFLEAEKQRLARRNAQHRERGLAPQRQETRIKLLGSEETGDRVTVDVEAGKRFAYELNGRLHLEERTERERIVLERRGGGDWAIQSILPYIGDHDATRHDNPAISAGKGAFPGAADASSAASDRKDGAIPSVPYLSRQVFAQAGDWPARVAYNREAARLYAEMWWNGANPQFIEFEVDCTNFISQCLFAGGAPMHYTGKRDSGWWYRGKSGSQELWSYSWAVAQSLQNYLLSSRTGLRGEEVGSPAQLTIGDVINYSWDGQRFTHSTIVTGFAADGMPLVNAHTINSRARYWDYRDSYAWTDRTRYRFIHIPDSL